MLRMLFEKSPHLVEITCKVSGLSLALALHPQAKALPKEFNQNIFMSFWDWWRLRQNDVITKKSTPQELFSVIGGC